MPWRHTRNERREYLFNFINKTANKFNTFSHSKSVSNSFRMNHQWKMLWGCCVEQYNTIHSVVLYPFLPGSANIYILCNYLLYTLHHISQTLNIFYLTFFDISLLFHKRPYYHRPHNTCYSPLVWTNYTISPYRDFSFRYDIYSVINTLVFLTTTVFST